MFIVDRKPRNPIISVFTAIFSTFPHVKNTVSFHHKSALLRFLGARIKQFEYNSLFTTNAQNLLHTRLTAIV